jgi:outer membrane receptor protein involved in Fe transport
MKAALASEEAKFRKSVRNAVIASLAAVPGAAVAQQPAPAPAPAGGESTELETLEVTGSRIRRVDMETASPVYTIDRNSIETSGVTTLGELLQEIPAVSGVASNPQVNNGGGTGAAFVSLRGLGEERTLVLLNGRRLGPAFDVNSIPINLIDRVEVLKEGAGAVYGSDAVGGVVNFITRRNAGDGSLAIMAGQSGESDGNVSGLEGSVGFSGAKGGMLFGVNYNKQDAISAADRDFSKNALYVYNYYGTDTVLVLGSSRNPRGRISLPAGHPLRTALGGCSSVTRIPGQSGATADATNYRCYSGAVDSYDYQPFNLVMTPQERTGIFAMGDYDINDSAELFVDYFHNFTQSGFKIAPLPFDARSDNIIMSQDSIYNPFGIDFGGAPVNPADPVNPNFLTRFVDLGNRFSQVESLTDQVTLGVRGDVGDTLWRWDLAATYQRVGQTFLVDGYIRQEPLQDALGPSFIDGGGVPRCGAVGAVIEGCTPINIFNVQDPTVIAQLDGLASGYENTLVAATKILELTFTGDVFKMPAGTAMGAVGILSHEDTLKVDVDALTASAAPTFSNCALSGETCSGDTGGEEKWTEIYGELLLPLAADMPMVESLNATIGFRFSDYDSFGTSTNFTTKLEYRPINDLLARVSYAEVFRAPTIFDRFGAPASSAPLFFDPCVGLTAADWDTTVDPNANPNLNPNGTGACDNVVDDGTFPGAPTQQIDQLITSNPDLDAETGDVLTAGFVYDPSWLPNFSATVDYWSYSIDDAIIAPDVNTVADACVETGDAAVCGLINRFSDGQIDVILTPTANTANFKTSGLDIGFRYNNRESPFGMVRASVDLTHTLDFEYKVLPGSAQVDAQGTFDSQFGHFGEWRGTGVVGWGMEGFDLSWTARFINGVDIASSFGQGSGRPAASGPIHVGSVTYHDVAATYQLPGNFPKLMIGIENVFDKQPPLFYQYALNANTVVETYDAVGMYAVFRVQQSF